MDVIDKIRTKKEKQPLAAVVCEITPLRVFSLSILLYRWLEGQCNDCSSFSISIPLLPSLREDTDYDLLRSTIDGDGSGCPYS